MNRCVRLCLFVHSSVSSLLQRRIPATCWSQLRALNSHHNGILWTCLKLCEGPVALFIWRSVQVLDELPKALALSVLQATPASLHQCLLHLPASYHYDVLLARFPSILSDNSLVLSGQESAKVEAGGNSKGGQDTISTALAASAAFPQLRQLRLSGICWSPGRVWALSSALMQLTAVSSLLISNCLIESDHITGLLTPVVTCKAIKKLSVTSCLFRESANVADALSTALQRMHSLQYIDLSKLPFRATDACQVLAGVAQVALLGNLKSVKLPLLNSMACTVTSFWPCLACCIGLTYLALTDAALTQDALWGASVFLGTLTNLEALEIRVRASQLLAFLQPLTLLTLFPFAICISCVEGQEPSS